MSDESFQRQRIPESVHERFAESQRAARDHARIERIVVDADVPRTVAIEADVGRIEDVETRQCLVHDARAFGLGQRDMRFVTQAEHAASFAVVAHAAFERGERAGARIFHRGAQRRRFDWCRGDFKARGLHVRLAIRERGGRFHDARLRRSVIHRSPAG